MQKYPSIETIYTRNKQTNRLDYGVIREPENHLITEWIATEKIDGTNIRVTIDCEGVTVAGRTDRANLPPGLEQAVRRDIGDPDLIRAYFEMYSGRVLWDDWSITLYGEGYGAGIQSGGHYRKDKGFRCFDILLNGAKPTWVGQLAQHEICHDLSIPFAPVLGGLSHEDMYTLTTREALLAILPASIVAEEDSGNIGVLAEGIVLKPPLTLLKGDGSRVMWKLTFREFPETGVALGE